MAACTSHRQLIELTDGRNFYQMRIDRLRNIEIARRNRDRLRDPSSFPSVPTKQLWAFWAGPSDMVLVSWVLGAENPGTIYSFLCFVWYTAGECYTACLSWYPSSLRQDGLFFAIFEQGTILNASSYHPDAHGNQRAKESYHKWSKLYSLSDGIVGLLEKVEARSLNRAVWEVIS